MKKKNATHFEKKVLIRRAAWLSGLGLFLVYAGLILTGALFHNDFEPEISRTALLRGISIKTMGNTGNLFLSVLVALACFTTAVGIVTGTADFVKSRFGNSQKVYITTGTVGCILGIVMGQFNVDYIIAIAVPALLFIYPVTLVLILLNVVPDTWASPTVFKAVVITTLVFSIPDFLGSIGLASTAEVFKWIPLQGYQMGWVLPAILAFVVSNVVEYKNSNPLI